MGALEGKVTVVTGASSGSGKAIARRFAAEGAEVVMLARGRERLEQAAADVSCLAVPIVTDVSHACSVRSAFAEVERRFGRVDVLINNAGVGRPCPVEEITDDDISFHIGTNLMGPIHTTRAALPLMRAAGGGDIVNTSSESTLDPWPYLSLYVATKAGLEAFGQVVAKEVKPLGIRVVNFVQGRSGDSTFNSTWDDDNKTKAFARWECEGYMSRVGHEAQHPDWVADVVLYAVTRPRGQVLDTLHVRSFA